MIYLLILILGIVLNVGAVYLWIQICAEKGNITFLEALLAIVFIFFGFTFYIAFFTNLIYDNTNINFVIWRRK